ncbi:antirestriction protein ArdA [Xanthomonas cannabis]|uniref:antirestriction protein ArdA n=1 Tax=Xanthomonas cannabis TaxID=1885674 RepID=UPI00141B4A85|nr:antirestriction protein ArdA [Xanthomonas cannabis]NIK19521.1 antirestriction protein [Xanthomonas cannabis]
MTAPRIYAACLASYNNGVLHGRWIDLYAADLDDVQGEIAEMLRESPHPNVTVDCPACVDVEFPITRTTCTKCGVTADYAPGSPPDTTRCHACGAVAFGCRLKELICTCGTCKGTRKVPSAEEYAVHDSEDLPAGFRDTEHPDLVALMERLQELEDLSDDEREAFDAFCAAEGDEDVETFRERYIGEFNSWAEVAEHTVEDGGLLEGVPESVARYFDFAAYGRDMELGGEAYESNGHYFWNR